MGAWNITVLSHGPIANAGCICIFKKKPTNHDHAKAKDNSLLPYRT